MPTLSQHEILSRLSAELPHLSRSLQRAASYVIDHPAEFGLHSIRQVSHQAGVSTHTLVRLAKALDFDTYDQFRHPFKQALTLRASEGDNNRWIQSLNQRGAPEQLRARSLSSAIDNITQAIRDTEAACIDEVVQRLLKANHIFLLGMRAPYALAHYFYYLGRMALPNLSLAPRHANTPADELLQAEPEDVLFAISTKPFTRETIQACRLAKSRGTQLILLTDSTAESLPLAADVTLVAPVSTPHFFDSMVGFLTLIDWILARLMDVGGHSLDQRVQEIQQQRLQNAAYWHE